jgi:hypothetical protein
MSPVHLALYRAFLGSPYVIASPIDSETGARHFTVIEANYNSTTTVKLIIKDLRFTAHTSQSYNRQPIYDLGGSIVEWI